MRLFLILLALAGCAKPDPTPPATKVQVVREVVEVQRPCSVTIPARPSPLARPLPNDAEKLAAILGAKLEEYAGAGRFADRVMDALARCTRP